MSQKQRLSEVPIIHAHIARVKILATPNPYENYGNLPTKNIKSFNRHGYTHLKRGVTLSYAKGISHEIY